MTEKTFKTLLVRLPVELKEWLEEESGRNLSSQGSEVVRAVRQRMESVRANAG
jgi:Arc/MetJ-type ribon-helix-helix transcriptional regulator